MFEPVREIITTSPAALVEDSALLGEQACQLFGAREEADFIARGGAVYDSVTLANAGVLGPSSEHSDEEEDDGGERPRRSTRYTASLSASAAWYERHRSRRRTSAAPRGALLALLSRLFYFPFNALMTFLTFAAYVLPWLRAVFPFAVPSAPAPVATVGHGHRGPEKVVAIAFHANLPLLAAAVSEGGPSGRARVVVRDVSQAAQLGTLTHAFQRDVEALAWKPCAKDVLVVGCAGGVLVWQLTAAESPSQGQSRQRVGTGTGAARPTLSAGVDVDKAARCVFYACTRHVPITALATSWLDGRYLACASRCNTYLHVLDLCASPASSDSLVSHRAVTVDGGLHSLRFAEDDSFLIAAVHAHPSLAMVRFGSHADASTAHVGTPAPVLHMEPATGIPHLHYYVLSTQGLEGALIARISPFAGVEVVAVISTALFGGVGGSLRCLATSHSRLYLCVETGHVVVCRYGFRDEKVTVMPIGVAALPATQLSTFPGFTQGSLLAVVERDEVLSVVPSYHS